MTTSLETKNNDNSKSIFWHGFLIWLMATIFYFYDNFLNVSTGAMKPELATVFAKSASDLGILSSCYLWAYGLLQIPAGILMDKFGPRKVLTFAGICCALGALFFAFAQTLMVAIAGRLFIGCGAAFAIIGCTKIASVWFSPRRFAFFVGLMVSIGYTGSSLGTARIGWIVSQIHWRTAMHWIAAIGFLVAFLLWLVVRDKPPVSVFVCEKKAQAQKEESLLKGLKEVSSCRQAWIVTIFAALMYVPIMVFGGLWGSPFLVEALGFERAEAGEIISLIFLGFACGGPIFGWISDHIGRRKSPMILANIFALTILTSIIYVPNMPTWLITMLMFVLGVFSSGFIISFAVMREKNRTEIAGTSIGFINAINSFMPAFLQFFIGFLLDKVAHEPQLTGFGEKVFSITDYKLAFISLPVCLIISLIIVMFLKETYCKPLEVLEKEKLV